MNFLYMLSAEAALVPAEVREWLMPTLAILMVLVGIALTVVILMQSGTNDNIGVINGGESDTYANKNKGKTREGLLRKLTAIFAAVMVIVSIVYFVIQK